eukprot:3934166-Rhodomonas_salina.2
MLDARPLPLDPRPETRNPRCTNAEAPLPSFVRGLHRSNARKEGMRATMRPGAAAGANALTAVSYPGSLCAVRRALRPLYPQAAGTSGCPQHWRLAR